MASKKQEKEARSKDPGHLTTEQILDKWRSIQRGALEWVSECVDTKTAKGSASALDIYKASISEIERIESRGEANGAIKIIISGLDPDKIETE